MKQTILITGASSGIGAACVKQAASHDLYIFATARNTKKLQILQKQYNNVQVIVADVGTQTGRNIIAESITQPLNFVLHNAAILDSPQKFSKESISNFRNNIVTNVEPIIFLTQKLIPNLIKSQHAARILSVSSGAAKQAIAGLANYCISKAAALMANQILKNELSKQGILVNDYFPGVVDTDMQKTLRSSTQDVFPYSDDFKQMKKDNQLNTPLEVATNILDIFINSSNSEFKQSEWVFKPHNVLDK